MIIEDSEARAQALLPVGQLPEEPKTPGFSRLMAPAFRLQNTVGSAVTALGSPRPNVVTPGFDPFSKENIAGYEHDARRFMEVESPDDMAVVKSRIDRERADHALLSDAGVQGIAAQMVAGVVDPVNFIPFIGATAKARTVGEAALIAGKAGLVTTAASEAALHASQLTRTPTESAVAIGAGTLLAGVLGGAMPLVRGMFGELSARVGKDITPPPAGEPDPLALGSLPLTGEGLGSVGAAAVQQMDAKIKSAFGLEKVVGFMSPILRTVQSTSAATRRTAVQLADTPFYLADNALGIATPISVETRIKMWQGPLGRAMEILDDLFVAHRKSDAETKLSFKEFREEVGLAMRRSDESTVPEAARAARNFRGLVFDPLKDAAIEGKLLPEGVTVETAPSYLTRVYNVQKIAAKRDQFIDRVMTWLKTEQPGDELEMRELANDITDHILGVSDGRIPYEAVPIHRGPTQERVFSIPDALIEDYLESDIHTIARFYTRTMGPDVELARTFGDPTMRNAVASVVDSYKDLIARAGSEVDRVQLAKQRDADVRDLEAMRDRLRGTYAMPADPTGFFVRGAKTLRNLNYLSMMGSAVLSSLADVARPVMVHGVLSTLRDGVLPLVTNLRGFRASMKETKLAGTALDMVLDGRALELSDIGDIYGRHSTFERGMQALVDGFGKVSLLSPWTAAMKQFSSVITQNNILRAVTSEAASGKEIEKLAMSGIDGAMAQRIAAQFKQHGEEGAALVANTRRWTDREAIEAFRGAVVKEVDRTIVSPGVGDRPLWMSTETGKILGQFRSFTLASTQRVTLAALQQRDMAVLNGALLSVGLGMLQYAIHSRGVSKETSEDPAVWVKEGVDRAGLLGWLMEANNLSERFTRGGIGLNRLVGGETNLRYMERNALGALLGPTAGKVQDIARASGAVTTGEFNDNDARAMRRLLPYQNVFYLRGLFDRLQDGQ